MDEYVEKAAIKILSADVWPDAPHELPVDSAALGYL
jgi:hypothetical protein